MESKQPLKGKRGQKMRIRRVILRYIENGAIDSSFWNSVDKSAGPDACWPWLRSHINGYGQFYPRGDRSGVRAHRVAHAIATGEEPEMVCHSCDNPPCCNPSHLFSGNAQINVSDMIAKGRQRYVAPTNPNPAKGEAVGSARLTEALVLEIRKIAACVRMTQAELAEEFGITQALASMIINRRIWRHV